MSVFCACGCGEVVSRGRRYRHGHNRRVAPDFSRYRLVDHGLPENCWIWTGSRDLKGYAKIQISNRTCLVHRLVYEKAVGPIPEGYQIDHLCRQTPCINPAHLEAVTGLENMRRRAAARTHCNRGHPFIPENIYHIPSNRRRCKICLADAAQRRKAAA